MVYPRVREVMVWQDWGDMQQMLPWLGQQILAGDGGTSSQEHQMRHAIQSAREGASPQGSGAHLLLTVLGTNPRPTRYALGDKESEARFAPVALLNLLPDPEKPSHVLALCTPEGERESWPLLKDDLGDQ